MIDGGDEDMPERIRRRLNKSGLYNIAPGGGTIDVRDLASHMNCKLQNCWCLEPRVAITLLARMYQFPVRSLEDEDRRGFQFQICPQGFNCCGWVTVIRMKVRDFEKGPMWADWSVLMHSTFSGIGGSHHAFEHLIALSKAIELGPTISEAL